MMKKITVDIENSLVEVHGESGIETHPFGAPEAFNALSDAWLRCGWDVKHVYSFTWLGRPIIQLPEDMMRIAEVIHAVQPDVIVETGVAHGGGLIFYATLCKAMNRGRVIGVDVEIRPHNRKAIEAHPLSEFITLIERDSVAPETLEQVRSHIGTDDTVMVMLDSCHRKHHVLKELAAYSPLVTVDSYIVAMDGIMGLVAGGPRTEADWTWNNPAEAAKEFVEANDRFIIEQPPFEFNEGDIERPVTYWPAGYLKRVR